MPKNYSIGIRLLTIAVNIRPGKAAVVVVHILGVRLHLPQCLSKKSSKLLNFCSTILAKDEVCLHSGIVAAELSAKFTPDLAKTY